MGKLIDLTGQTFGKWTVLERGSNRGNRVFWKCRCECGTEREVDGHDLRRGKSLSCGCLNREKTRIRMTKDLTNQTFGLLTVLYQVENSDNNRVQWHCKCKCGREKNIIAKYLINGNTQSCGCLKASHGELKIMQLLEKNIINYIQEWVPKKEERLNLPFIPKFDFYIPSLKTLVEYDGGQHFYSTGQGWNNEDNLKRTQEHDKIKNEWALENGFTLIRIPYTHYENLCIEDLMPDTSSFIVHK